jgi:hypothetical protein
MGFYCVRAWQVRLMTYNFCSKLYVARVTWGVTRLTSDNKGQLQLLSLTLDSLGYLYQSYSKFTRYEIEPLLSRTYQRSLRLWPESPLSRVWAGRNILVRKVLQLHVSKTHTPTSSYLTPPSWLFNTNTRYACNQSTTESILQLISKSS